MQHQEPGDPSQTISPQQQEPPHNTNPVSIVLRENEKNHLKTIVNEILNDELNEDLKELCKEIRLLRLAVDELCSHMEGASTTDSVDLSTTGSNQNMSM